MNRVLRKYHRIIAVLTSLPLLITIISGILITIIDNGLQNPELSYAVRRLHTMDIIGLQSVYPLLNGLALLSLIATGISISLFNKRSKQGKTHG